MKKLVFGCLVTFLVVYGFFTIRDYINNLQPSEKANKLFVLMSEEENWKINDSGTYYALLDSASLVVIEASGRVKKSSFVIPFGFYDEYLIRQRYQDLRQKLEGNLFCKKIVNKEPTADAVRLANVMVNTKDWVFFNNGVFSKSLEIVLLWDGTLREMPSHMTISFDDNDYNLMKETFGKIKSKILTKKCTVAEE